MPTLTLADAINVYYKQVDLNHKLWTYQQVVAGAVVTFTATHKGADAALVTVGFSFAIFAVLNCWLLYRGQRNAVATGKAVQQLLPTTDDVKPADGSDQPPMAAVFARAFTSLQPEVVATLHAIIDLAVLALVSLRIAC